jgi:hypothetical protein
MRKLRLTGALVASCLVLAIGAGRAAEQASADDTAKFLAGMEPSAGSPLAPLTQERAWQQHAKEMNRTFARVEKSQLSRIRDWAGDNLKSTQPAMFYMFSGPDFLYANAFFPEASTYVLSGLEPVGQIPDLMQLQRRRGVTPALNHLQHSMKNLLSLTFFITKTMREDLDAGGLRGTLPILYVFLARAGKQIRDVQLVNLDKQGEPRPERDAKARSAAHGVKIVFTSVQGREQTLYYFSTDLANDGVRKSGFLKFCETLGYGDSFIKSASYLLHHNDFSRVREFLLEKSALILQDDSGIPLRYFDAKKWALYPFGRYLGPIEVFPGTYQDKLRELFRKGNPGKIKFGVGYRWRPGESNLLLAINGADMDMGP